MKIFRGYMEDEYKKNIIFIIVIAFCIILSANIYSSIKSYKYRRLCDQYREQLYTATETNRTLADRIGRIAEITGSIGEICNRNVTDAREIIEITEELRAEIKELEDCCGGFDYNKYYEYYGSYYRDEGLMQ